MVVKQTLLDFRVARPSPATESWVENIETKITEVLQETLGVEDSKFQPKPGIMLLCFEKIELQCTIQVFRDGLVTLDVVQFVDDECDSEQVVKSEELTKLRDQIKERLACQKADYIPTITRGRDILCYYDTSDERIIEYDFDRVVYQEKSPYQSILIAHSTEHGNMLFLDDTLMIADNDIAYTHALLGNGREDYTDKTVLILGGGDGGVLHELLKQQPKHVLMVEIDKLVVEASREHLKGVCGDALDSLIGNNYEILIKDCVQVMRDLVKEGKTFDYIINDLTDVVIAKDEQDSDSEFPKEVKDLSIRLLSSSGKNFVQGKNGRNMLNHLEKYEEQLKTLNNPVDFKREFVFVPSFQEFWAFYEIWKKNVDAPEARKPGKCSTM